MQLVSYRAIVPVVPKTNIKKCKYSTLSSITIKEMDVEISKAWTAVGDFRCFGQEYCVLNAEPNSKACTPMIHPK